MNIYQEKYKEVLDGTGLINWSVKFGTNVRIGHGVVIEKDCIIGNNVFIGHHTVLRPKTIIGDDSIIGHLSVFEGECIIGDRVLIHSQCHITKDVIIEDDVFIAPFFCGANTARIVHGRNYPLQISGYHIGRAARIALCVSVAPGIIIGENALIGVNANVTKNVPPRQIWYGNPARFQGHVPAEEIL
jgi:acetyltransferase-like isoleucine patch superfamily enzyme